MLFSSVLVTIDLSIKRLAQQKNRIMTKLKENLTKVTQVGALCLAICSLAACGLKGELYLPEDKMPTNEQAQPKSQSQQTEQEASDKRSKPQQ